MNHMRHLIQLVEAHLAEEVHPQGAYYLHVTSGANLPSILADGLQQKDLGNYSGYMASLPGVYVTRKPELIRQHIFAREIEHDYALIVVRVASPAMIDEDVLDIYLDAALKNLEQTSKMDTEELAIQAEEADEDIPYESIGQAMVPFLLRRLGKPTTDITALLVEFCAAWFGEQRVGTDGPGDDWWIATKEQIQHAFPALSHPRFGADYSLRLPGAVGFEGDTRIIAIVRVTNNKPKVVKGQVPPEAQQLVRDCL
jgi:hypothetical protein